MPSARRPPAMRWSTRRATQRFELTLAASRSGELVIITAASRDTTEVRLIPASRPLERADRWSSRAGAASSTGSIMRRDPAGGPGTC